MLELTDAERASLAAARECAGNQGWTSLSGSYVTVLVALVDRLIELVDRGATYAE